MTTLPAGITTVYMNYGNASMGAKSSVLSPPSAYWRMEAASGSNESDYSGNGLTAIQTGSPVSVAGRFGQGRLLDGSTSYFLIPAAAALNTSKVSVTAWINLTSTSGVQFIFQSH